MIRNFFSCKWIILFCFHFFNNTASGQLSEKEFSGWEHLNNEVPQWLQDAKFGIYFHWGVYTVPAFHSEWYSRSMYVPGTGPNKHHDSLYGSLKNFGYKDFIPMFRAEHFNADEWVDLFVRAGAKFAGPVAEHADGFSMWNSKVNPWNAHDMGPKKDIVGLMEQAVRSRNLKFLTTFHHQWQWGWYPTFDSSVDAGNPAYASLYGPVISKAAWQHQDTAEKPNTFFNQFWLAKVKEVVNAYHPDLLYFDSRLGHIGEKYRKEVVTTFLGNERNKKVVLYKGRDLPVDVGMRMYEKSRMSQLSEKTWLTEEPISTYSWSYTTDMKLRPAEDILKGMIDVVSKNGIYLLNICPKANGTIPAEQQKILLSIGNWLAKNGEAIYGTRPWHTYGEGPRQEEEAKGVVYDRRNYFELKFTNEDVRYTTKENTVYALILGVPDAGKPILLQAFAKNGMKEGIKIKKVSLLGSRKKINWKHKQDGLSIQFPSLPIDKMVTVVRIDTAVYE